MIDNTSAFHSNEYDQKIRQTFPYYEEFYVQVTELVKTAHIGAGTVKIVEISVKVIGSLALLECRMMNGYLFQQRRFLILQLMTGQLFRFWKSTSHYLEG